jgi:hypothetical protein
MSVHLVSLRDLPHTYSYTYFYSTKQIKGGNKNSTGFEYREFKLLFTQGAWSESGASVSFCYYFFCFLYLFYHGRLGMMGNLAGWKHEARVHGVCGILT